ncbi:P-loop containing nucleoside triphosphate hydrolase protein [Cylindrobasidium torrendii FP15055 ss-10]|uniref:Midasin n=1 Tax=Cylindrobasidium torrendii FP15055 ss-10 TaxID=1314674 RepID=A0A0D7BWP6_9AGAR|nr:P-loop containing nucleoside triphosphate hydrolase protein [Cylindrobasidium torrendii FP15055 ss-10]
MLLEVHEELSPILHCLLQRSELKDGPLIGCSTHINDRRRVHRLLLAYYRLLQVNRELPSQLSWSLGPLSAIIWEPLFDPAARLLAIRCYAQQSGMGEAQRNEIEQEVLGEPCAIDCPLHYFEDASGPLADADGWIMPVIELRRVQDARAALARSSQNYFDDCLTISASDLCPLVCDIEGVLLLRASDALPCPSTLILTPTARANLRIIAHYLSLRVPILLTSPPSSGKTTLLTHLATQLFPQAPNQIVTVHLADTSLDPRSLIGSYVSSPSESGAFEWKEGVMVRAMRQGKWILLKDINRASPEVLGILKPLLESYGLGKWIGGSAFLDVPSRGRVTAHPSFAIFASRSVANSHSTSMFLGAHKYHEVTVAAPTTDDLQEIIGRKFPRLCGGPTAGLLQMWNEIRALGTASSMRQVDLRDLERFCTRIDALLPPSFQHSETISPDLAGCFPNTHVREQMFLQARDIFFGAAALTAAADAHLQSIIELVSQHLGLDASRRDWLLTGWAPDFKVERDVNDVVIGVRSHNIYLPARPPRTSAVTPSRPFAMHRPAILLLSRIATSVSLNEPVLLTGETGTGKTSVVTHLASLLQRPLISLNLSHQTESADLVGGFKPVDARVAGSGLQERFMDLFGSTFSRKKNEKFEGEVRKAVNEGRWKRAVGLWKDSTKLARDRIRAKASETLVDVEDREAKAPRKRRKVVGTPEASWAAFENDVEQFEIHHVLGKSKFAFDFVEGPLVSAVRNGNWVLLDEINLASSETLECISSLIQSASSSITLTEQGSLEPVPRHPDFRLFACMNPATDVGKKDLPPNIRCRFTEIGVCPPDNDQDTLISIVTKYIGHVAVGDKASIMNVAEFYVAVKQLAETRTIADGANHRPHFSMRTLARGLTFAADIAPAYGLRRAIWEGCLMAFTMALDGSSLEAVTALAHTHLLAGVSNKKSVLTKMPLPPSENAHVRFGPFYLEKGPLAEDPADDYIVTPSVEAKLIGLARIILTRRFPVLLEGPTSAGKTSSVEYLARRTGHHFVRINNHEHTDIQEYIGSYVADPITGKLAFQDGLLVRALRLGHWIVLDELNLAPTDVLEALNRLLDDNRELVIPETQEVVRPHPHFMIFATQNPPGLYAGRKVLSRAFRNRFLEVHFDDVPEAELETILCERSRIAPSYCKRIVTVFRELQNHRQSGRVFESKSGFATLRDLFRWANRDAMSYQELANNGFMLLGERARRADDKQVVKDVIEKVMNVRIDEAALYNLQDHSTDFSSFLGCAIPSTSDITWTSAMQRLFVLLARALRFNEPVLLVGETGCGKTSVCQVFAQAFGQHLHTLNCQQGTETADLIGGLRPIRNRLSMEADIIRDAAPLIRCLGLPDVTLSIDALTAEVASALKTDIETSLRTDLEALHLRIGRLNAIFEWHDGPLVVAMAAGDVFLLDEISLADDSVLERLNSVLEPSRTIVLAEKGGDNTNGVELIAADSFKLVATMNPGGDYGKKELSPALRNRFTEIWVPSVDNRHDLELIVGRMWRHDILRPYTSRVLDFAEWLCGRIGDRSPMNLRDIIAWVAFSNAAVENDHNLSADAIFNHAARMTYVDGLGSLPQLSGYSKESIQQIKIDIEAHLATTIARPNLQSSGPYSDTNVFRLGAFAIPRGLHSSTVTSFNFRAATTSENAARVVRACQLPKPILLEGSPGVGKTSLITALARASGHKLCRINLSDQTDLADLFGSDLPVEGGSPGEFAWRNAEFLKALIDGHWVLLDEMNLAPQAVLEGLNSVLDHRGTVFIPELGRSFVRHPSFRIFAAQNPLNQGSGRKGLPKSFLNRFTKVYVEELTPADLHLVCCHLFPDLDAVTVEQMVAFNSSLSSEVTTKRGFGHEGSPWEFNLRDVIRWGTVISQSAAPSPIKSLRAIYLQRFRNAKDREQATKLFELHFHAPSSVLSSTPALYMSSDRLQVGIFNTSRRSYLPLSRPGRALKSHLCAMEAVGVCIQHAWLAIITGGRNTGKTQLIRTLAHLTGNRLHELSLHSSTETADILGSFEQVDRSGRLLDVARSVLTMVDTHLRTRAGSRFTMKQVDQLRSLLLSTPYDITAIRDTSAYILDACEDVLPDTTSSLKTKLKQSHASMSAQFEWYDGPLVEAMRQGHWLLMDGANLCNPSVLDRLNSVCEVDGVLTLNERGQVDGDAVVVTPHPSFRLFMSADPQYGELSRAMRNRGIEITLLDHMPSTDDIQILADFNRLPIAIDPAAFDAHRRGLLVPIDIAGRHSSGFALTDDSALSTITDQAPRVIASLTTRSASLDACHYFAGRTIVPAFTAYAVRFLNSDSNLQSVASFIQRFSILSVAALSKIRPTLAVRSAFTSIQPIMSFEVEETTLGNDGRIAQLDYLPLLDLCIALFIDSHEDKDASMPPEASTELQENVRKAVSTLREHGRTTARDLLALQTKQDISAHDLLLASDILRYNSKLNEAVSQTFFDYSSLYAIAVWMEAELATCPPSFASLQDTLRKLLSYLSLVTGAGLVQLWPLFLQIVAPNYSAHAIESLEQGLARKQEGRQKLFNLVALSMADPGSDNDLLKNLIETSQPDDGGSRSPTSPEFLLAELHILNSKKMDQSLPFFLDLVCRYEGASIVRMAPYQSLLWQSESSQHMAHRQQLEWLKDIVTQTRGASVLLQPTHLIGTLSVSNLGERSMGGYLEHLEILKRNALLLLLQCDQEDSRAHQLQNLLGKSVGMVSSAFDAGSVAQKEIFAAAFTPTKNPARTSSASDAMLEAADGFISFARMLLHLSVPNIPIDPAVINRAQNDYLDAHAALLAEQINLHHALDLIRTGDPTSNIVEYLEAQRSALLSRKGATSRVTRNNVSRLQMFWAEVNQFRSVVSEEKLGDLLEKLRLGHEMAGAREESVQQSIHTLLQRLATAYREFEDLTSIVCYALTHLQLGLRIVRHIFLTPSTSSLETYAQALSAFPSVQSSSRLVDLLPNASDNDVAQKMLLSLRAVCFERRAGLCKATHPDSIRRLYDAFIRLWNLDQERAKKAEQESQSLYRNKENYEDLTDEEREAMEFRDLFPSYDEDVGEDDQQPALENSKDARQPTTLISASQMQELLALHVDLFATGNVLSVEDLVDSFNSHRVQSLATLPLQSLSYHVDENLFLQLRHLNRHLVGAAHHPVTSTNFYTDSNVDEIAKAVKTVKDLRSRVVQLTEEWPDQMVLHHLISRCDVVLALPMNSPIARVLSALEQLLLQTEDWELFANRSNNLQKERSDLIALIVEWRRLELTCWDTLLESENAKFQNGIQEWWFRLYDALFRGAVAAYEEGEESGLTTYLGTLLPMLDQFVRSSPVGQFGSRLNLIATFKSFCQTVIPALPAASAAVLIVFTRVQELLNSTYASFDLYSQAIATSIRDQRSASEKEVKSFIKLASWKDINVQALKASAQRTHHQLYKIIRKFREVLRAPVAGFFIPQSANQAEGVASEVSLPAVYPLPTPTFPAAEGSGPSHLENLERTYARLVDLSDSKIRPFLANVLPRNVEELSSEIITGIESLSVSHIPAEVTGEKRTKHLKALLVRKRKAWSDLLKELKRAGFATNLSTETLANHQDKRWIREQPSIAIDGTFDFMPIAKRGDHYFRRLEVTLNDLRTSIPGHHSDLTTRELQRGVMFVESCFGMSVDLRARLAHAANALIKLEKTIRRMRMISSAESIHQFGTHVATYAQDVHNLLRGIDNALDEAKIVLSTMQGLQADALIETVVVEVTRFKGEVTLALDRVYPVVQLVELTSFPIIFNDEVKILQDGLNLISNAKRWLDGMTEKHTRSHRIFKGISTWLSQQPTPSLDRDEAITPPESGNAVIDACLVGIQGMLKQCTEIPEDIADRDNHIRADYHSVKELTSSANLSVFASLTHVAFASVIQVPERFSSLQRFLPFVEQYFALATDQLTLHAHWMKSLFKLSFVLCSLLRSLATEGFCKPPDSEDTGDGGAAESMTEGLGMGEGTGDKNVSNEIEEEHQVEGLKGEENPDGEAEGGEDDNAIEMADDVGGDMQDVPDEGSQSGDQSDEEEKDEDEMDEQIGDLDASDPDAVDEKLWGDEQGPEESAKDEKTDKDHSTEQQAGESEVVAKEGEKTDDKEKEQSEQERKADEMDDEGVPEEQAPEEQDPQASGAPMDDHVPEADTLDLPDDMDLGLEPDGDAKDQDDDADMVEDEDVPEDGAMEDSNVDDSTSAEENDGKDADGQAQPETGDDDMGGDDGQQGLAETAPEDDKTADDADDGAIAPPDIGMGDDSAQVDQMRNEHAEEGASGEARDSLGAGNAMNQDPANQHSAMPDQPQPDQLTEPFDAQAEAGEDGAGTHLGQLSQGQKQGQAETQSDPRRSIGDALKEAHQTFNEILQSQRQERPSDPSESQMAEQLEHIHPDDNASDMQALAPAEDEQTARLRDLKLIDEEAAPQEDMPMDVDAPEPAQEVPRNQRAKEEKTGEAKSERPEEGRESAIVNQPTGTSSSVNTSGAKGDVEMAETPPSEDVELAMRRWQESGAPVEGAEGIWRLYENLTHDLAYALCEQLRLILEPTLATRLKGDYRTGKRLNMKKIIPYIASDYTKDKIWLRRTRPSQREYQILIALDDSRSMSESHSVHLAYQTMTLVSKALTRLEAGDIGIARFGQTVDIIHGFTDGPFTDQTGTRVVNAFQFDQKATNVLSLVDRSLQVLEQARERRSSGSAAAADLWQLEVIISDGICQDHERLRSVLRKAEEQRVMIVFIIIDSLDAQQGSIFTMKQVDMQTVDGRMEMKLNRYLDTFPFEYYVVLRDVEALPEVLSTTLKQFFERVSEE